MPDDPDKKNPYGKRVIQQSHEQAYQYRKSKKSGAKATKKGLWAVKTGAPKNDEYQKFI